jgi:hypothetical protein
VGKVVASAGHEFLAVAQVAEADTSYRLNSGEDLSLTAVT